MEMTFRLLDETGSSVTGISFNNMLALCIVAKLFIIKSSAVKTPCLPANN
jgi:hypothetical protein